MRLDHCHETIHPDRVKGRSLNIIHIIPGVTEEASGPTHSVNALCQSLIAQGHDVTLAALDWGPVKAPPAYLITFPLGFGPRRLGRSPALYRWLHGQCNSGRDLILHNHGMWMMNAVYPAWASGRSGVHLVQSTRGALTEWALRWGSKLKPLFWFFLQKPALQRVACFHATADEEYLDIRRLGFWQPVAIIPNGIDVPVARPKLGGHPRTLLFLGRIHPNKGLDLLLPAWRAVQEKFPEWRLRIVGPDDGCLKEMEHLARRLGVARAAFEGPLYGEAKTEAYRQAELFVLPSYSENFGMAVAEALAAGTPAIVSKGAPWSGIEKEGAGWWVEIGVDPLVAALETALAEPPDVLRAMGARGREWMVREYSWELIGHQMASVYRWLLGQEERPPCVRTE